ncbi:MAG: nucleotidyltransferase family protein, partial [bacterium]
MQAVVLAGGQGTRLKPFTLRSPKQLLPLANKPFILYLVEYLNGFGIEEIIFSLCYKAEDIMDYLGTDNKSGSHILFSVENEPLGTAGALKNVENYLKDEAVLVMNGDLLTDINITKLIETHRKKKSMVTIALKEVEDPTMYGLVLTDRDGHVKKFTEKPTDTEIADRTINAGIYVIEPKVVAKIPPRKNVSFERDLYPALLEEKVPFYSEVFHSYWLDVGTLATYFRAHRDILAEKIKVKI